MDIASVLIQAVAGAVGGNAGGKVMKDADMGSIGNTLAGIIGGLAGGNGLAAILGSGAGGLDIASIISQLVGGGAGGAILTIIVGMLKNKVAS